MLYIGLMFVFDFYAFQNMYSICYIVKLSTFWFCGDGGYFSNSLFQCCINYVALKCKVKL